METTPNIPLLPGESRTTKTGSGYTSYTLLPKGTAVFFFEEFSFSKQSAECLMEIDVRVDGEIHPRFTQRIDLHSGSARRSLATDLNAAYGNKTNGYNWVLILNGVFNSVTSAIRKEQVPISVSGMEYQEIPFLLYPFLQEKVSNLLFASSEVGKTWFALRMALSIATGKEFMGYQSQGQKKTLFIDYEDDQRTFANRLHKMCRGLGLPLRDIDQYLQYYKPTGSLRDNVELLRRIIINEGVALIIIDAGGDAAGGSPSDEEKVLDLFNGLEELPCTKLILHHEPKNVQNESAAFYGSMYWKARSRVAWRLEVENETGNDKLIKATIQKRSNLPYIEPIYYKTLFEGVNLDEIFSSEEPAIPMVRLVQVNREDLQAEKSVDEGALEALERHGEMSTMNLQEALGRERSVVFKKLKELEKKGVVEQVRKGRSFVWKLK